MRGQQTFGDVAGSGRKRRTRQERFLDRVDALIPWADWVARIRPFYPSGRRGRPPKDPEVMLRMYFVQIWFSLSAERLEDALYDSLSLQRFVGIDLMEESVPDATTLLKFRHRLEHDGLAGQMQTELNLRLAAEHALLKKGVLEAPAIIRLQAPADGKRRSRGCAAPQEEQLFFT